MPRKSIKTTEPKVIEEKKEAETQVEETTPSPKVEEPPTSDSEYDNRDELELSDFERIMLDFDSDDHLLTNFLDDIRNTNVSITLQLNKDDFKELAEAHFPLSDPKRKLINCRRDIRMFLNEHPCCMSSTKDKMKQKIIYYLSKHHKLPTITEEE